MHKPPYQRGRFHQNQRNQRGRGGQCGSHQNQLQLLGKGLKMRDMKRETEICICAIVVFFAPELL